MAIAKLNWPLQVSLLYFYGARYFCLFGRVAFLALCPPFISGVVFVGYFPLLSCLVWVFALIVIMVENAMNICFMVRCICNTRW